MRTVEGAAAGIREPPETICIVMPGSVADSVHVLPLANTLRKRWPEVRITWVAGPRVPRLFPNHPAIHDARVLRTDMGIDGWSELRRLGRELGARPFDLLLSLDGGIAATIATALAPARLKVGFDSRRTSVANTLATTGRIPARPRGHVQDEFFEFAGFLSIDPHPARWTITLTEAERAARNRFLERVGRPVCAVVVGAEAPDCNWTAEGYAGVVEALDADLGLAPVLLGASSPEGALTREILKRTRRRPRVAPDDDPRTLVWMLDAAVLAISPDTGALHISRALETPVVGLYGRTNPKRSGPYRLYQDLVVDGYADFPGEAYPIATERRAGMGRVTVENVLEKVALAMERHVSL